MSHGRKNFGDYIVVWDDVNHKMTFTPKHRHATATKPFGLGNATIILNVNDLPTDGFTIPISGETVGDGVLPTVPFKLRRWHGIPKGLAEKTETLTGYNNFQKPITFSEAESTSLKEVSVTTIEQHGYGCQKFKKFGRLEW